MAEKHSGDDDDSLSLDKPDDELTGMIDDDESEEDEFFDVDNLGPFEKAYVHRQFMVESDKKELVVLYIPFFAIFLIFMIYGQAYPQAFGTASLLSNKLLNTGFNYRDQPGVHWKVTFNDMQAPSDFWKWVKGPLYTTLYGSEPAPNATVVEVPDTLIQHIGAVRFRQIRAKPRPCLWSVFDLPGADAIPNVRSFFPEGCYDDQEQEEDSALVPDKTYREEVMRAFNHSKETEPNSRCDDYSCKYRGQYTSYSCCGYNFDLPYNTSANDAREIIEQLEQSNWVDETSTRVIFVEMFVYNPNNFILLMITLAVEFTAGGGLFMSHKVTAFSFFSLEVFGAFYFVGLFIFMCLCLIYLTRFLRKWARFIFLNVSKTEQNLNPNLYKTWKVFFLATSALKNSLWFFIESGWHIVDVVNLCLLIAVWYYRITWFISTPGAEARLELLDNDKFSSMYVNLAENVHQQGNLDSFNCLICMARILYYLRLNATMSLLTNTLAMGFDQIVTVGFLFIIVLASFAITAQTVYGSELSRFATFVDCCTTLLRMLLGDLEYAEMKDVHSFFTPLFCVVFYSCSLFLLLNLVIAVLTMALQEVRERNFDGNLLREILMKEEVERRKEYVHTHEVSPFETIEKSTAYRELRVFFKGIEVFLWKRNNKEEEARLELMRMETPQGYWRTVWRKIIDEQEKKTPKAMVPESLRWWEKIMGADEIENPFFEEKQKRNLDKLLTKKLKMLCRLPNFLNIEGGDDAFVHEDVLAKVAERLKESLINTPAEGAGQSKESLQVRLLEYCYDYYGNWREFVTQQLGDEQQEFDSANDHPVVRSFNAVMESASTTVRGCKFDLIMEKLENSKDIMEWIMEGVSKLDIEPEQSPYSVSRTYAFA